MIETRSIGKQLLVNLFAGLIVVICICQEVEARDLFAPKEQATTEADPTESPSFDEQKTGVPQSLFTWIKMAKGYVRTKRLVHAGSSAEAHRTGIGVSSGYSRDLYCIRVSPAGRSCPVQRSMVSGGGEGRPFIRAAWQRHPGSAGARALWIPGTQEARRRLGHRNVSGETVHYAAGATVFSCGQSSRHHAVYHRRRCCSCRRESALAGIIQESSSQNDGVARDKSEERELCEV